MQGNTLFEKSRIADRLKSVMTLCLFVLAAAFVSAFLINLVITPIAMLAIGDRHLFNVIMAWAVRIGLVAALLHLFIRRIYNLRKDGHSCRYITRYMFIKPIRASGIFLSLLLVTTALIAMIYLLFSYNYYLIYKLTN